MSRYVFLVPDRVKDPRGGIMNIVRHGELAVRLGAEAVLATDSGKDPHGRKWFLHRLPVIKWRERRPDDICVIPDLFSDRTDAVAGRCIIYMQTPIRLYNNFDHTRPDLAIWSDSPLMFEKCTRLYPGKDIPIVPNIVDSAAFPFVSQAKRKPGMMIVFPRKGSDFIGDVFAGYARSGRRYWKPRILSRMRFDKLAQVFGTAQAFLASADVEGCALPPQESMAAGVVVCGKNANGANFCMQHGKTALVSQDVSGTVENLMRLEDDGLRERLADAAYEFISRYFPAAEPTKFWRRLLDRDA
jgi:hypothetical protein